MSAHPAPPGADGSAPRTVRRDGIETIAATLLGGGVVLLPTDTVFGLAALPGDAQAVARLFALKRRPVEVRLPVMVADADQIPPLGVVVSPSAARLLASRLVPGPLTIAFGFADGVPRPAWLATRDEVAVRIPDDATIRAVARRTGPLFVTSANAHGSPTLAEPSAILAQLAGLPDLVVTGTAGGGLASTLVNCRHEPPVIERVGSVSARDIGELLA